MSDVKPFLATVASRQQPRAFAAALPAIATPAVRSPWTPEPVAPVLAAPAPAAPAIDVAAIRAAAEAEGRAAGLEETAALRSKLAELCTALAAALDRVAPPAAELVAEAASTVVEAWTQSAARGELFTPVVKAWLARGAQPDAAAHANPADAAALKEIIGDAPLAVVADPACAPGELRIRGGALELEHSFAERRGELRAAIIAAIEGAR